MYIQNQKKLSKSAVINTALSHSEHMKNHIGKKIKVEYLTPNSINEIYGQLIKVGTDFISIKLPTSPLSTVIFKTDKIIKITVIFE